MGIEVFKMVTENSDNISLFSIDENVTTEEVENLEKTYLTLEDIEHIIRNPLTKRQTRYYLLHYDEQIKKDITEYVLNSGNLTKNNSTGQRNSLSLTLCVPIEERKVLNYFTSEDNRYKTMFEMLDDSGKGEGKGDFLSAYDNELDYYTSNTYDETEKQLKFLPYKAWDDFDMNEKIMVVTELFSDNVIYRIQEGIFVTFDPKLSQQGGNISLTFQLYDKFSLLDGTIDGKGELDYELPAGSLIYDAVTQLLRLPKNMRGEPYDLKEIRFPPKYRSMKLAYTIKKTADNAIGDILKDIAQSISCDVYYDEYGHLNFSDTLIDLDYHHRQVAWFYDDRSGEFSNPSLDIKRSQIKNRIVVIGTNINGFLCRGEAENTNPKSLYNINGEFGIKSVKITDNLIPSNSLCEARAQYELKKTMREYITLSFQSAWIPHLKPDDIIRITLPAWGIDAEEFIIKSISLPLNGSQPMSITATNLSEISL